MPDLNLDEIEKRYEKATPGPWEQRPRTVGAEKREVDCEIVGRVDKVHKCSTPVARLYTGFIWYEGDKDFIAHARTDIPALVAEVKRLRKYADDCIDDIAGYEAAQVKLKDNALEEAAKICDRLKVAECLARHDEDDDIWNDALDQAIEKIRALKTNKGE